MTDKVATAVKHIANATLCLLIAMGSAFLFFGHSVLALAAAQSRTPGFSDGISPTSMMSGNMPQAALSTFYNRKFLENLKARLVMLRMCTRMPTNSTFSRMMAEASVR